MRVESKEVMVYTFSHSEREYLVGLGVWGFLNSRLKENEVIKVE